MEVELKFDTTDVRAFDISFKSCSTRCSLGVSLGDSPIP